jgi:hypothetical protein
MRRACVTGLLLLSACSSADHDEYDAARTPDSGSARAVDAGEERDAARDAGRDAGPEAEIGGDYVRWLSSVVPQHGEVTLAFDVPDDARSFVWTLDPGATPRAIELLSLVGPDGEELLASGAIDPASHSNVEPTLPYALMLPSAPDAAFATGRYEVRVAVGPAFPSASTGLRAEGLRADVVWQRAPVSAQPRLSLALWFAPEAGLDAAAAQRDRRLQTALTAVREIYTDAGIELASIAYRDLDGAAAAAFASIDDATELRDLFDRIADRPADDRALDLAFVAHYEAGAGKTVRSKATGLPVPPAHPALARRGGVLVPIDTLPDAPERIADMLAHEIGHALGLRHTSEYDGERHDPIDDTPACPEERARAKTSTGEHVLTAEDCADLDGHNLMFCAPPFDDSAQRELTAGQAFVLARNPFVN